MSSAPGVAVNADYADFKLRMARWDARGKVVPHGASAEDAPTHPGAGVPTPLPLPPRSYRVERKALKEARQRCLNPSNRDFAAYGGRGIKVSAEWCGPHGFERFLNHIGPKPTPRHTLDRTDPNGNYEPGNVRWATWIEQANNRRSSTRIEWRGETHTAAEWGRRLGIRRQDITNCINRGKSVQALLDRVANDNDRPPAGPSVPLSRPLP